MKGYIYIVTNDINNKVYIGQTINPLNIRFREHLWKSRRHKSKFYNAIRKYGEEHFKISLVEECEQLLLNEREKFYIKKYDSFHNGYNSTLGGEGTLTYELDEDEVVKLYEIMGLGKIAEKYGCCTKVIKSILVRNNIKIREYNNENVKVVQLDNGYNVLNIFPSKKDVWRWLTLNYRADMKASEAYTYIKRACEFGNTAFGYKWMYLDDIDTTDRLSILDNIEIQKYNKANNITNKDVHYNKVVKSENSGRSGKKCYIILNGEKKVFESMKELAKFVSILDSTNITDNEKLRKKAYNIKTSLDKGIKYKGFDTGYL